GGAYVGRVVVSVSGAPGLPITFREHPGEQATISGRGITPRGDAGLIHVDGDSHLEFEGFELRDLRETARRKRSTPAGVFITGASSDIALRGLDIHGIRTRAGDAHGIAAYGSDGDRPIANLVIEHSYVHDLKLGSSEAIVLNGNVDGWRVSNNAIDDVDNIGIDAIGYEGTAPRNDRARNGVIADNVITDVDTLGNFAYDGEDGNCRCAGGIYVDGGHRIVVERNRISRSNLGIELASEARRGTTSDVLVRNNVIVDSDGPGMPIGGYDSRRGKTERVQVVHNTIVNSDRLRTGQGELLLNYRVSGSTFLNNVVVAGRQGLLVGNPFRQNARNAFDGNVWFARGRPPAQARWQWRQRGLRGFGAWQRASGGDAHGRYADPLLDATGRPGAASPAIDAGVVSALAGATDVTGAPRAQGAAPDAGAFELR
ncbi:MAG TPA: right-handed parallel beta-helix repeat-containing protein, partial [Solirubrobacteraceae bacterium]